MLSRPIDTVGCKYYPVSLVLPYSPQLSPCFPNSTLVYYLRFQCRQLYGTFWITRPCSCITPSLDFYFPANDLMLTSCSVGRFTIPLGLVVLVALISGPTRAGIEAWLPLYITTVDIVTVSIWHILKQIVQANLPSPDNSNIPSTTTSDAPAQQQHRLQNSTMTRWLSEPLAPWATYILRQDTRYSPQSERSGSSMSLSSSGQARPSWGPRVLGFWLNSLTSFYSFSARYNNEVGPSDGEDLFIDVEAGSTTPLFQYEEDGVTSEPWNYPTRWSKGPGYYCNPQWYYIRYGVLSVVHGGLFFFSPVISLFGTGEYTTPLTDLHLVVACAFKQIPFPKPYPWTSRGGGLGHLRFAMATELFFVFFFSIRGLSPLPQNGGLKIPGFFFCSFFFLLLSFFFSLLLFSFPDLVLVY